jgi:hypothetical protein
VLDDSVSANVFFLIDKLGSFATDLCETLYLRTSRKFSKKQITFYLNMSIKSGTLSVDIEVET